MKKLILVTGIISCFSVRVAIATVVPGGLVSGTWTLSGSPYNVNGSIQIPNDSTLTIEAGVTVNFPGSCKLNVLGRLIAIGTITDTITFTTSDLTNGWKGIRFDNTAATNDTSKIIYCKLQYAKATGSSPDNCGGALYFNNFSKAIISNSSILNNITLEEREFIAITGPLLFPVIPFPIIQLIWMEVAQFTVII